MPQQIRIDGAAKPTWPPAPAESTADLTAGDAALPAPDASAFEPDSGVAEDRGDVHWPDQPPPVAAKVAKDRDDSDTTRSGRRGHGRAAHVEHIEHAHRQMRGRPTAQTPDLTSRIKSVAALFSPSQEHMH
jgi:hypothetical protein